SVEWRALRGASQGTAAPVGRTRAPPPSKNRMREDSPSLRKRARDPGLGSALINYRPASAIMRPPPVKRNAQRAVHSPRESIGLRAGLSTRADNSSSSTHGVRIEEFVRGDHQKIAVRMKKA